MKEEGIFFKESCSENSEGFSGTLCQEALEQYNTVFTSAMVASVGSNVSRSKIILFYVQTAGTVIFGFMQKKCGLFYTRLACGICTSSGLVLFIFYAENAFLLYAAMILGR